MSEREPWTDDVIRALERRIEAAGAQPDFLDVVTRAHALDPDAMPSERVAQADALGAAEGAPPSDAPEPALDAELDTWLGDVRVAVERRVEQRRAQPRPELPAPPSRRGALWIAAAALAAAIVLMLGAGQLVQVLAERPADAHDQALRIHEPEGSTGVASKESGAPPRAAAAEPSRDEPGAAALGDEDEVAHDEPSPEADAPAARRKLRLTRTERLRAMSDEAQAHWRAGRRDEARRLFALIAAKGGRSRAAEMAYADLFTLASQAGDVPGQRQWWKAYLRRFPRGRFADDASAGLCRTAAAAPRERCWSRYLDQFPRGSFRGEAQAAGGHP